MTDTDATPSGDSPETLPMGAEDPILYTAEALDSYRPEVADHENAMAMRTRDGRGQFRRDREVAKRDAACTELYAQGFTYREIADRLSISVSQAHRGIRATARDGAAPAAEALRTAAADQLAEIEAHLWEIVEKERYIVSAGRVTDQEDEAPRLAALGQLRAVNESTRKLHGVDSPAKVTVDGGVRYVLEGVDPSALT